MAGNDWNSFLQSRSMQLLFNGLCTVICAFYAVDGVLEMLSPERSAAMMGAVGPSAYYVITVLRVVVCVWVAVVFGRMTYRVLANDKDE